MKIFLVFAPILALCLISKAAGSAIPIWESLSKTEKMSRLFEGFKHQVDIFCSSSSMPDCNKNLLVTASKKLSSLSNEQMDLLDPYQRNSEDMIWDSLVGVKENSNDVEDHYSLTSTVYTEGENDLAEESSPIGNFIQPANRPGPLVVGPMVSRVMPDGRPVPEDQGLPKDEDLEDFRFSPIPSIKEIETKTNSRFYHKGDKYSNNALISPYHDRRLRSNYPFIRNRRNNYPLRESFIVAIPIDFHYF